MSGPAFTLRPYAPADEDATVELWQRTWQLAYPRIDFAARLDWWRERWRLELVPAATITVAEANGKMVGFVTVDPRTFDLDQIVVAPEAWGVGVASALMAEAKRISPAGLDLYVNTDNARAIQLLREAWLQSFPGRRSIGARARQSTR